MTTAAHAELSDETRAAVITTVEAARRAARSVAQASTEQKNAVLAAMADGLRSAKAAILDANLKDVEQARSAGLSAALVDRLVVNEKRLGEMVVSVESVAALPDPVGEILRQWRLPNGIEMEKVRVPLGVIGIIYESRPNVTSDCGSLCLKSGNAVVLRGGSEAFRSNRAIADVLKLALAGHGLPEAAISFIPVPERAGVDLMLQLDQLIDVIIPRGGEALIRKIVDTSRIPVIKHAKGVCHIFVDEAADPAMARAITVNAKCQRPATCNALETLLVHADVANSFLPQVVADLRKERVEVRGCEATRSIVADVTAAREEDWSTEYLDRILSVKVVPSLDAAVDHIARYGSGHSDGIVTQDETHASRFLRVVDSSAVYVNASTRFTDGYEFGLGAEIGISTDRLHARGPMGLEELTTYKYIARGTGQIRQ